MKGNEAIYTIPLRDVFLGPKSNRSKKAVKVIKDFLIQHTKAKEIKLDSSLNEALWKRSIRKPPRRIRVKAVKDKEMVRASLAE